MSSKNKREPLYYKIIHLLHKQDRNTAVNIVWAGNVFNVYLVPQEKNPGGSGDTMSRLPTKWKRAKPPEKRPVVYRRRSRTLRDSGNPETETIFLQSRV